MAKQKRINIRNNRQFIDNALINDETYFDYLERFKKVALSIFEWVNLPKSMNAMYLEKCLYYFGMASLLKDKGYGFINTQCNSNGYVNIYGLPTSLNCHSFGYQSERKLYTGLNENLSEAQKEQWQYYECILVQNNWERTPTARFYGAFRPSSLRSRKNRRCKHKSTKNTSFTSYGRKTTFNYGKFIFTI